MEKVQVISVKPISSLAEEENLKGNKASSQSSQKSETSQNNNDKSNRTKTLSFISRGGASFSKSSKNNDSNSNTINEPSLDNALHMKKPSFKEGNIGYSSERFKSGGNSRSGFSFQASSASCFGRSDFRASYNERIRTGPSSLQQFGGVYKEKKSEQKATDFVYHKAPPFVRSGLHRSNSSLELDHELLEEPAKDPQLLRREYGSQGSINVVTATQQQESIYSILQNYNDSKQERVLSSGSTSPKIKHKIRLWDKEKSSIFKKFRPNKPVDIKGSETKPDSASEISLALSGVVISNVNAKTTEIMESDNKVEDIHVQKVVRRSAFAHYDCQSLAAQLSATRLKSLLADRSNTTTGASAAATADPNSPKHRINNSTDDIPVEGVDCGDGKANHLVSSCPFFHNEIGGEGERIISLSRENCRLNRASINNWKMVQLHRSVCASSIGLLEPHSGSSHWCQTLCPYVNRPPTIESIDQGSTFYTTFFQNQDHQNWFGIDDNLGPVAVSIKREKLEDNGYDKNHSLPSYQYRIVVRTSELCTCQGTIREESLSQRGEKVKGLGVKEALEYVCPQLSLPCLRLGTTSKDTEDILLKIDELGIQRKFKVGVLYCRAGQKTEEDMYNNENAGPAFSEFLETLGQRVRLKNFEKYRGGLDKNTDSTGHYSVYAAHHGCEIMFHVSTLLPFTSNNRKQLLRKRHIGNDIVTIIFQEPGALPFSPKNIRSHFMHVFIVVQAVNPCTDNTMYSFAVSRFQDVPMFGPPIPEGATFPKSKKFTEFLLAKVINGQIAALRSDKFAAMATRTKHEYLKELALNHSTSTSLDTSSKFSLMGFSRASKKEKSKFKFVSDSSVRGALSWLVSIHDATLQQSVDCILAVSIDSIIVVEESSVIFATACKSILGWTIKPGQGLLLFYHQGECLIINLRAGIVESEGEEILSEIVSRLSAVTQGAESQELVLRRNSAGLLGFNVQQDGIITEVEPYGLAAKAGLQQGSRLVEICTIALATLCQEQMVDLLKTSMTVTVTVIPPHKDGTPRKGCNVPTCSFLLGCSEGDYENLTPPEKISSTHTKHRVKQLSRCDRSLSPPRSGSSSGYGTGSSSHSFSLEVTNHTQQGLKMAPPPLLHDANAEDAAAGTGTAKEKSSSHQMIASGDNLKYDYTSTISSTSSSHSNDRWSEVTPDDLLPQSSLQLHSSSSSFHSLYSQQKHSPSPQRGRDSSSPPPPLPARTFQTPRDQQSFGSSVQHKRSNSNYNTQEYISDGKLSPYSSIQSSFTPPTYSNYEQSNYAVPAPIVKPIHKESVDDHCTKKSETNYYDYDNTHPVLESLPTHLKQNFRRNSSPQTLEGREEGSDISVHSASLGCLKSRHSIPKNLSEEGKALEDQFMVSRSEDELSVGSSNSPHGFPKIRSSGSSSSPSLSSPHKEPPSVVRLKQSAASSKNSVNRNSTNYTHSNLQDELLKLINPDYLSDSENRVVEVTDKNQDNNIKTKCSISKESVAKPPLCNEEATNSQNCIYDCPNVVYQTIGEAEFSNRKSVFTKSQGAKYSNACKSPDLGKSSETSPKKPQSNEGIVLTARPATVISNSSTASSPAVDAKTPNEASLNTFSQEGKFKEASSSHSDRLLLELENPDRKSHQESNVVISHNNHPHSTELEEEWSTLVHTATQAIEKKNDIVTGNDVKKDTNKDVNANGPPPHAPSNAYPKHPSVLQPIDERQCEIPSSNFNHEYPNRSASQTSFYSVPNNYEKPKKCSPPASVDSDIQQRIEHLEKALVAEQARSGQLEEEVSFLRSENLKLQEDSRTTAQQLHQFTEWFFNTIDKG